VSGQSISITLGSPIVSIVSGFDVDTGGAVTFSGNLVIKVTKDLSGSITPSGTLSKKIYVYLTGAVSFIGDLVTLLNPPSGTLNAISNWFRRRSH
jgi:hypothetical protein